MGKIDEVKEFIGYLKVLLALVLATIISLIGWLASHYNSVGTELLIGSVVLILVLLIVFSIIDNKIIKDIKSLKDL